MDNAYAIAEHVAWTIKATLATQSPAIEICTKRIAYICRTVDIDWLLSGRGMDVYCCFFL